MDWNTDVCFICHSSCAEQAMAYGCGKREIYLFSHGTDVSCRGYADTHDGFHGQRNYIVHHLFKAVKLKGFSMEARQVHMFCAYWGFLIMSVHLGMHWNMVIAMMERLFQKTSTVRKWLVRTAGFGAAGYGAYAFYKRQIGNYLLMKMHFVFYDYTEKTIFFMADYLAIMIFMAMAGYYMGKWLKGKNKRVSQKAVGGRAQ